MDLKELNLATQNRHPWEVIRADFIVAELRNLNPRRIVDVGSGDGYLGARIEEELGVQVMYVDSNFSSLDLKKTNHFSSFLHITSEVGDVVLLADVLEHIEDADAFLSDLNKHFFSKTSVLITVPAFQSLFSEHDVFLGHFRRYNKKTLQEVLIQNMIIEKLRYFYIFPLLIRLIQVILNKYASDKTISNWSYSENSFQTQLTRYLLRFDLKVSRFFGLSLMAVGRIKK